MAIQLKESGYSNWTKHYYIPVYDDDWKWKRHFRLCADTTEKSHNIEKSPQVISAPTYGEVLDWLMDYGCYITLSAEKNPTWNENAEEDQRNNKVFNISGLTIVLPSAIGGLESLEDFHSEYPVQDLLIRIIKLVGDYMTSLGKAALDLFESGKECDETR